MSTEEEKKEDKKIFRDVAKSAGYAFNSITSATKNLLGSLMPSDEAHEHDHVHTFGSRRQSYIEEEQVRRLSLQEINTEDIPKININTNNYKEHNSEIIYVKGKAKFKKKKEFEGLFFSQLLQADSIEDVVSPIDFAPESLTALSSRKKDGTSIWNLKMSKDGLYLAASGQKKIVWIWKIIDSPIVEENSYYPIFQPEPFKIFKGHKGDVLDLCWSSSGFLLSSSMDKTVKLWHITKDKCLYSFQHEDFVTSIKFHPKNDKYFLSGSLDGKIRLWNIPEKKVVFECMLTTNGHTTVDSSNLDQKLDNLEHLDLVTAVGFSHDGKYSIAGSYHGLCVLYLTEGLNYNSQIQVCDVGKNKRGGKITGIDFIPPNYGDVDNEEGRVMITSNDSAIRIFNIKDKSLCIRLKGLENQNSQIKAALSHDNRYVISGSENHNFYIWGLNQPLAASLNLSGTQENGITPTNSIDMQSNSSLSSYDSQYLKSGGFKKGFGNFFKKSDFKNPYGYERFEYTNPSFVTSSIILPLSCKRQLMKRGDYIFNHCPNIHDEHVIVVADYEGLITVYRMNSSKEEIQTEVIEEEPQNDSIANIGTPSIFINASNDVSKEFPNALDSPIDSCQHINLKSFFCKGGKDEIEMEICLDCQKVISGLKEFGK